MGIKNPAGSFGNQMMTRAMIWKSLPTSGDQGDVLGTEPWEAQSRGTSQPRYPTINPVNGCAISTWKWKQPFSLYS